MLYEGAYDPAVQTLRVDVDLASCTVSGENIISIGHNISVWGGSDNVHLYYEPATSVLRADIKMTYPSSISETPKTTLSGTACVIEIGASGIVVNGTAMTSTSQANKIIAALSQNETMQIGSKEGWKRSHATYNKVEIIG
jgi:hypothetical protein